MFYLYSLCLIPLLVSLEHIPIRLLFPFPMPAISPQSSTYADLMQQGWRTFSQGMWSCVQDGSAPNLPQVSSMSSSHSGLLSSSTSSFSSPPTPASPILLHTYLPYLAKIYFVLSIFSQWIRSPTRAGTFTYVSLLYPQHPTQHMACDRHTIQNG